MSVLGGELGYLLRRTALKALPSSSTASFIRRPRTFVTWKASSATFKQQCRLTAPQCRFASDNAKLSETPVTDETVPEEPSDYEGKSIDENIEESKPEARGTEGQPDTAVHVASETTDAAEIAHGSASSPPSSTFERAQQTASNLAESVANTASTLSHAAGAATGRITGSAQTSNPFITMRKDPLPKADPSKILYVGNLYFEVKETDLRREFSRFGQITQARVVYDNRGLSKGFGYVEFDSIDSATAAIRGLDNQVLEGRRMTVQYHIPRPPRPNAVLSRGSHPPSKTIFIGNMSFEMTDRDLNDLFREIRNVLDVRVAIDRRSGQPRGFAHADFVDIASAQRAMELLADKEVYGRRLRVDFSSESTALRGRTYRNEMGSGEER
ncbi:MAG: hypothetical protein M1821_002960 [Bathelium mastoideum]|nr:MAG: hypothetical protein M1821_002960 [Bathelium mastoideum]